MPANRKELSQNYGDMEVIGEMAETSKNGTHLVLLKCVVCGRDWHQPVRVDNLDAKGNSYKHCNCLKGRMEEFPKEFVNLYRKIKRKVSGLNFPDFVDGYLDIWEGLSEKGKVYYKVDENQNITLFNKD